MRAWSGGNAWNKNLTTGDLYSQRRCYFINSWPSVECYYSAPLPPFKLWIYIIHKIYETCLYLMGRFYGVSTRLNIIFGKIYYMFHASRAPVLASVYLIIFNKHSILQRQEKLQTFITNNLQYYCLLSMVLFHKKMWDRRFYCTSEDIASRCSLLEKYKINWAWRPYLPIKQNLPNLEQKLLQYLMTQRSINFCIIIRFYERYFLHKKCFPVPLTYIILQDINILHKNHL